MAAPDETEKTNARAVLAAKIAFGLLASLFAINAYYVYAVRFAHFMHADAAVTVLLGERVLHSWSPVVRDWYYANGDVWVFAPHLYGAITVAMFGTTPRALLVAVVLGLALEIGALVWAYRRLGQSGFIAWFATLATLTAWSRTHVLFVYIELAYGFVATMYIVLFVVFIPITKSPRRWESIAAVALTMLISLQNPMRGFVFVAAPVVGACLWPFRGFPWRSRLRVAAHAIAGFCLAFVVYRFWFTRILAFSPNAGHIAFVVKDAKGIAENFVWLAKGLVAITGGPDEYGPSMVPGLLLLFGAFAIVLHFVLRSREMTPLRFFAVLILGQGAVTLAPMLLGNLMLNPLSARYVMPTFLPVFGIATILAKDALKSVRYTRFLALGFLVLMPVVSLLVFRRTFGASLERNGQWSNRQSHADVADALVARDLRHGFSTYWNAGLVTLLSNGKARTCSTSFGEAGLVPYKWVTETECYDPATLPDRFYIVSAPEEREFVRRSAAKTLHEPTERFIVGDGFEISVWETKNERMDWLLLPLVDGEALRLPLRMPVTHPQWQRFPTLAAVEGTELVGNGAGGTILFGPYLHLPHGDYRLRWIGRGIDSDGEIAFDAGAIPDMFAQRRIAAKDLPRGKDSELVQLDFTVDKLTPGVEFRVFSVGGGRVALSAIELSRR